MHPTSVSVLTPPGAGAIGVIRLRGSDAVRVADEVFQTKAGSLARNGEVDSLRFGRVIDDGEVIDEGLASVDSANGIEFVDLCVHGGIRVIERTLDAAEKRGATAVSLGISDVWGTINRIESEA